MIDFAAIVPQLLLAFFGALFGALLGGAVSWSRASRERRLNQTLDLYAEFHTPVFNHLRIVAHEALAAGQGAPEAYAAAEGEAKEAVASLVHYWEKVALLLRIGAVDEHLVRRFLGQYAVWWRDVLCSAPALEDEEWGATLREIDWLFGRIGRKATARPRR